MNIIYVCSDVTGNNGSTLIAEPFEGYNKITHFTAIPDEINKIRHDIGKGTWKIDYPVAGCVQESDPFDPFDLQLDF